MSEETIVNGKTYPLWNQFVDEKEEWIGGRLESWEGSEFFEGIITDITLKPNGDESAYFRVEVGDLACGFDVRYGGILGSGPSEKGLNFLGPLGHQWAITKAERGTG